MDTGLFITGMVIGLTLAVPVGPIALMCIRRAIADGRFHGIASGIGVATADSFYAAVTVLGLTVISGIILSHQVVFRILACLVLILVGLKISISLPAEVCANTGKESYLKDYFSMLAIAIANPLTIIFFATILPGFGFVIPVTSPVSTLVFVLGVFCGSTVWWIILCGSLGSFRSCISTNQLRLINRISGIAIACFGVAVLFYLCFSLLAGLQ